LLRSIAEKKTLTDEIKNDLKQALTDFKDQWGETTAVSARPAAAASTAAA
jgi:hypothetical protein